MKKHTPWYIKTRHYLLVAASFPFNMFTLMSFFNETYSYFWLSTERWWLKKLSNSTKELYFDRHTWDLINDCLQHNIEFQPWYLIWPRFNATVNAIDEHTLGIRFNEDEYLITSYSLSREEKRALYKKLSQGSYPVYRTGDSVDRLNNKSFL